MTDVIRELHRRAVEGVKAQGALAYDPSLYSCGLRIEVEGCDKPLACAVGQLINDEHYIPEMEGFANPTDSYYTKLRLAIAKSNADLPLMDKVADRTNPEWIFLKSLQEIHDTAADLHGFIKEAEAMNLEGYQ